MTIRSTAFLELDIADVSAAYVRCVQETCPEQLPLAVRLLERLPPARWMLEWHLPWWLAQAFDLDPGVAREIVLSNLLGLGSIRLQDDLADGDVASGDAAAAQTLAAALYEAALLPYRVRFDLASPFWAYLDSCMTEWRTATLETEQHLAGRGAPLRISAFASCLLANRPDVFPALERCLDQALEAMVLYDHVADWETDLDAGRWNAFVAGISSGPQVPAQRDHHRSTVLVSLMTTDAAAAYHARIGGGMLRAAEIADALPAPVAPLATHLRAFATGVGEHGTFMREHYHGLGERAANLLLSGLADAR